MNSPVRGRDNRKIVSSVKRMSMSQEIIARPMLDGPFRKNRESPSIWGGRRKEEILSLSSSGHAFRSVEARKISGGERPLARVLRKKGKGCFVFFGKGKKKKKGLSLASHLPTQEAEPIEPGRESELHPKGEGEQPGERATLDERMPSSEKKKRKGGQRRESKAVAPDPGKRQKRGG